MAVNHTDYNPNSDAISSDKTSVTKPSEAVVSAGGNTDAIVTANQCNNNIEDKNVAVDSKEITGVKIKKEKKLAFEDDDPFSALDWKDGIATLPGDENDFC